MGSYVYDIYNDIRGLSEKLKYTANKTRIVYHRPMKFYMNKYQLSGTMNTQYNWLFLNIDWFISHYTEQGSGARSTPQFNVHTLISLHFQCTQNAKDAQ